MDHSQSNHAISLTAVAQVESYLDPQELYSIIFLLYEDVEMALQDIHLESRSPRRTSYVLDSAVFRSSNTNFHDGILVRWARYSMDRDKHWQDKFLEALLLIKNYMCIEKILGKSRRDLDLKFAPSELSKSHHVNLFRKFLFLMVEDLPIQQWKELLTLMIDEARLMRIEVPCEYRDVQEGFLLFLLSRNVLQTKTKDRKADFQFLSKCLKKRDYFYWAKNLETIEKQINSEGPSLLDRKSNDSELIPRFNLDADNQGTVLIFNQEDYGGKLRKNIKLEFREGSQFDCDRLKKTFSLLNFVVKVFPNTSSTEMVKQIRKYVQKFCSDFNENKIERCFVVVILAHGDEDGVICTDGKDVRWESIRGELRNSDMLGLPRLLLSQACKGPSQVSQTERGLEVVQDGSGNLRDLFEFHSCVSGFAAFRSKHFGSFFIISLCKHVLKFGGIKNLIQIAMLVIGDLEVQHVKYHGGRVSMIPELIFSSSKDLYLAVPECNKNKAKLLVDEWEKEIQNQTSKWRDDNKKSDEKTMSYVNDKNERPNSKGRHQPVTRTSSVDIPQDIYEDIKSALLEITSQNKDLL